MDLSLRDIEMTTINLTPDRVLMQGDTVLVQYIVQSWELQKYEGGSMCYFRFTPSVLLDETVEQIKLVLILKRRIINELLTTYLPTVLILSIVYATNFFKPFFFESIISTNLTSLLVLTTLFISVSQTLPPTAYVKMIDIWLIFAQLIPFLEVSFQFFLNCLNSCICVKVLLHTFMDALRDDDDREINNHGNPIPVDDGKTDLLAKSDTKVLSFNV